MIDLAAPHHSDGHNNENNILTPEYIKKRASTHKDAAGAAVIGGGTAAVGAAAIGNATTKASGTSSHVEKFLSGGRDPTITSAAPGSSTAGLAAGIPLESSKDISSSLPKAPEAVHPEKRTTPPGGFPESSGDDSKDFKVDPIPASSGLGNPISLPAGEKVPDSSTFNPNTIGSTVTTSKADFDKDASADVSGLKDTMKEPEVFGVTPIPASSGIGNPIDLPAGEKVPDSSTFNPNTISSTATTSKEDYEKSGSSFLPGALAGGAVAAGAGAVAASAFHIPDKSKNLIPESSLPMNGEAPDVMDKGPTISSAAPESSTAALAGGIPLEPKRDAFVDDRLSQTETATNSAAPNASTTALAGNPSHEPEKPGAEGGKIPDSEDPTISSAVPGSTTAGLAAGVPLESNKGESKVSKTEDSIISSAAPGSASAALAGGVPLESKKAAAVDESLSQPTDPTISSVAPGSSTADAAANVPLEPRQAAVVDEKLSQPIDPTMSSVEPVSTTAALAGTVPKESEKPATVEDDTERPQAKSLVAPGSGAFKADPTSDSGYAKQSDEAEPAAKKDESKEKGVLAGGLAAGGITGAVAAGVHHLTKKDGQKEPTSATTADASKSAITKEPTSATPATTTTSAAAPTASAGVAAAAPLTSVKDEFTEEKPSATVSGPQPDVPEVVQESLSKAHAAPEAASSASAVHNKEAMESELLKKVDATDAAGEPAPSATAATSATAPAATNPETSKITSNEPMYYSAATVAPSETQALKSDLSSTTRDAAATPSAPTTNATADTTSKAVTSADPSTSTPADEPKKNDSVAPAAAAAGIGGAGLAAGSAIVAAKSSTTTSSKKDDLSTPVTEASTSTPARDDAAAEEKKRLAEKAEKKRSEVRDVSPSTRSPDDPKPASTPKTGAVATSTPDKKSTPAAASSSSPAASSSSSPAATKEKKKKNRVSGFFKKLLS